MQNNYRITAAQSPPSGSDMKKDHNEVLRIAEQRRKASYFKRPTS